MRDKHARIKGAAVRFEFRGKSGIGHAVDLHDRRLTAIVKACRDLPGQDLFQYVDDAGRRQPIESADVNTYLREIGGQDFTAKDFRTWAGTVLAAKAPLPRWITGECRPWGKAAGKSRSRDTAALRGQAVALPAGSLDE